MTRIARAIGSLAIALLAGALPVSASVFGDDYQLQFKQTGDPGCLVPESRMTAAIRNRLNSCNLKESASARTRVVFQIEVLRIRGFGTGAQYDQCAGSMLFSVDSFKKFRIVEPGSEHDQTEMDGWILRGRASNAFSFDNRGKARVVDQLQGVMLDYAGQTCGMYK